MERCVVDGTIIRHVVDDAIDRLIRPSNCVKRRATNIPSSTRSVVRAALQGAASVAGLLITTEAMVAELPKKESPAMPGGGGMGGMDY